jgi:hypothetical protein
MGYGTSRSCRATITGQRRVMQRLTVGPQIPA